MYFKAVTKHLFAKKKQIQFGDHLFVSIKSPPPPTSIGRQYCTIGGDEKPKEFSLLATRKLLKANGTDFVDGFACIETACPVCETNKAKKACKVFVNKTTGNVTCPTCQLVTVWSKMEPFFSASKSRPPSKELQKARDDFVKKKPFVETIKISENAVAIEQLSQEDVQATLSQLRIEFVSAKTLEHHQCLCDPLDRSLYFPLKTVHDTIVGYRQLAADDSGTIVERTFPENDSFGLCTAAKLSVKVKSSKESTMAVLVLSLLDLLALSTYKSDVTMICLPHSFKSLPQQCLAALERFHRLTLWFDADTVGWDAARNFAKKLDEKRCLFVRPTDHTPTPYAAVQQAIDLKSIIGHAQPILHKAITTFAALRQDVLSDLQNIEKVQGVKWQRYPVLNKLLKGHRKGELTILTGPTGCGKTTFMSEYSLDLTMQGVTTLWGSFEIRNTRLASTLLRQLAGYPLNDENIGTFDRWADELERLSMYFMTFHGQQSIKIVMEAIEHAQYVHDIQHVIIDNVQFMMGTQDEPRTMDRFWRQDSIIAAFRTFATRKNCHVTLVIHPRKERDDEDLTTSSIFGSAKATQEADNVLIIQDKRLTAVRGKKYLQIAKNRYSGDLGIMPLDFDKLGLSYAPKRKKLEDDSKKIATIPATEILVPAE